MFIEKSLSRICELFVNFVAFDRFRRKKEIRKKLKTFICIPTN